MKFFTPFSVIPEQKFTKDNLREWTVYTNARGAMTVMAHTREVSEGALLLSDHSAGVPATVALFAPGSWSHLTADPIPED